MKKLNVFAGRCAREMWRDPLSFAFGLGFPVALLTMMWLLGRSLPEMPQEQFGVKSFAPSMAVFGQSFLLIFLGTLISGDRASSFLVRMFASPLRPVHYILGYTLPAVPISIVQSVVCLGYAALLGLEVNSGTLVCLLVLIPSALLYISIGLLLGTVLPNASAVGGISSLLINVSALLSGTWFPMEIMGGTFRTICSALPFYHAVTAARLAVSGDYASIPAELAWVLGYTAVLMTLAVLLFRRKMKQ